MLWSLKKYFLFCDDKIFYFLAKYLGVFFCHVYMNVFCDNNTSKNIYKYVCETCDFKCCKVGDYKRHILTSKHKNLTVSNGVFGEKTIKNQYICNNCKKEYNSRNGLWKHKKSCKNAVNTESKGDNNIFSNETTNKDEFIKYLMEENIYFKNIVLEISKNITVDKATIE